MTTCNFAVALLHPLRYEVRYEAAGGSGSVTVSCAEGCEWTAASQVSWITLTAGASGTHQRQRGFQRRAEHERAPVAAGRCGVAGHTVTITQTAVSGERLGGELRRRGVGERIHRGRLRRGGGNGDASGDDSAAADRIGRTRV